MSQPGRLSTVVLLFATIMGSRSITKYFLAIALGGYFTPLTSSRLTLSSSNLRVARCGSAGW